MRTHLLQPSPSEALFSNLFINTAHNKNILFPPTALTQDIFGSDSMTTKEFQTHIKHDLRRHY